ncbi:hypothetical protein VP1G_01751 [Cytospora mali]|uniref:Uncharacterized protein n=1 Tax=Cytospora mali TaxID=578113 RepID=A0A194URK6_CYTMA|nr:hypothetical protein VP1G_01751 [Valsa mali var. pyri (nom. inval.)]
MVGTLSRWSSDTGTSPNSPQSEKVSQLPKPLQRPNNWLGRLSVYTNKKLNLTVEDLIPQCAVLCDAHKGLNPWVVHRVFLLLSEEVTRWLDPLRRYLEDPARYDEKEAVRLRTSPGEVRDYVDRMNALLSLWTGPEVFARIVGGDYPPGLAVPRVGSDCEVCIVACVGARGQALCDLRAMMCGRSHRRGAPVLLRLVEAWIGRFDGEDAERLLGESAVMARDVRRVRRRVVKRRGGHRHRDGRHHRTSYEKRERERVRMERDLDCQNLTATQRRIALGRIDGRLDEMFGGQSKENYCPHGKHSSSSALSFSPSTLASSSNAPPTSTFKPSRHNNDSTTVDNRQQSSRRSWENYSYINDGSCSHDGENDIEPFPDYNDDVFDEADPDATYRLQDQVQSWYDRYTDVGADKTEANNYYAHPAFSQKVADIKDDFVRSQVAMSAVPLPLQFTKGVAPQDGKENDDENDEEDWVPAAVRTEVTQWTDISVHTLATQSTNQGGRGAGRPQGEEAPPVPRVPSVFNWDGVADATSVARHYKEDHSMNVNVLGGSGAAYGDAFAAPPSSVYSNDAPTAAHPPPVATTLVPGVAYPMSNRSNHIQSVGKPVARFMEAKFENPRTPPRAPRTQHRRRQPGDTKVPDAAPSEMTYWPDPHATSAPDSGSGSSSGSRHRQTPSSGSKRSMATSTPNTTLSGLEFQAGLDRMNDEGDGTVFEAYIVERDTTTTTTILPGDSVSAVGRFYPPQKSGAVHCYQVRRDQIDADEVLARQLARVDVCGRPRYDVDEYEDSDDEGEEEHDIRKAKALSRETAREGEVMKAKMGKFSDMVMPDSDWI